MTIQLKPIHQKWVNDLRANPKRQGRHCLGIVNLLTNEIFEACCLGQLIISNDDYRINTCGAILEGKSDNNRKSTAYLKFSYQKYGLYDETGKLKSHVLYDKDKKAFHFDQDPPENFYLIESLAHMNDFLIPWAQIADFVEQYPDWVFVDTAYQQAA